MKQSLKDELMHYLGELMQDYDSAYDYLTRRRIHREMEHVCEILGITNIKFNPINNILFINKTNN